MTEHSEDSALAESLSLHVEVDDGVLYYFNSDNQQHRVHGPAVIRQDGTRFWMQRGELHRVDGPAVEWSDGDTHWYLYGKMVSEDEFNERIKSL